ncbi:hypothetical protein V2J09_010406 [Rumex salicifolius]
MSSFNGYGSSQNLDNLFLQNLMGRLQIRPPPSLSTSHQNPLLNQTLEDILLDAAANYPFSDDESDADSDCHNANSNRSQLAREESRLEKEIIKVVLSGKTDSLKPNSGQAVSIGEHHICIGFHEESGSDYRVWEWHGHIMLFDEEDGFTPEYIYGNYFERVRVQGGETVMKKEAEKEEEIEEQVGNLGLRELIEQSDSGESRILHRNSVPILPNSMMNSAVREKAIDIWLKD